MKAIIYCTNRNKLANIGINAIDKINSNPDNSKKNKLENDFYFLSTREDNKKVILIFDQLDLSIIKNKESLNGLLNNAQCYFVYHTPRHMHNSIINHLDTLSIGKQFDLHEEAGDNASKYYIKIKNIIETGILTDEQFDELWKDFEQTNQLNETLDLLHNILNGAVIEKDNLPKNLKNLFETHYNITEKYKDEYETELVALRDAILEEKLAKAQ